MKKICVLGAESTGTTTLAQDLANWYKTVYIPEYGRIYFEKSKKMNDKWKTSEFVHIAQKQNNMEDELEGKTDLLICDTNSFATRLWHKRYMGFSSKDVDKISSGRKYDLYIITDIDIPFVQDGTRDGKLIREKMHNDFVDEVKKTGIPYIIVSGSRHKRLKTSIKIINRILNQANNTIRLISDFITRKRLSKLELNRLKEDLNIIYERLRKREYTRTRLFQNKFDIADKTREVYINMKFYSKIGRTWERIFRSLGNFEIKTIADVCPGYTPKVELGLYYSGYKGKVTALDYDQRSLLQLRDFTKVFNPGFELRLRKQNVFRKSKQKYDFVAANHSLDDLILYYFAKKKRIDLQEIYKNEKKLVSLWKDILNEKDNNLQELHLIISKSFDLLVKSKGLICIVQYKSYTDKMLDLKEANKFTRKLFLKIYEDLLVKGYSDESRIIKSSLSSFNGHFSAKNCLLLRRND